MNRPELEIFIENKIKYKKKQNRDIKRIAPDVIPSFFIPITRICQCYRFVNLK